MVFFHKFVFLKNPNPRPSPKITMELQQQLDRCNGDIAEIKVINPEFHNELQEENINPESVADFRKFMNLKRHKIDLQKRLNRVEATRTNSQSIRVARENFRGRSLNLDEVDDFHLPPLRNPIFTRMSILRLSPISNSGSVHSIDSPRSESQSPPPDFDKC